MDKIKTDIVSLRKFGLTISACFTIITTIIFLKHKHSPTAALLISFILLMFTIICPKLLKYFYVGWMKLAFILGWINTRILLCALFYLIFTPVGLFMRLFRIDLLDKKLSPEAKTYWKRKEKKSDSLNNYEMQS